MIELKRDLTRQMALRDASREVAENGLYIPDQSLLEKRDAMRSKMSGGKRRRRIPWFTIITIITTIPFFMGGESQNAVLSQATQSLNPAAVSGMKDPEIANMLSNKNAKVSVSFGGKTFEKEITAQDVRAAQSKL